MLRRMTMRKRAVYFIGQVLIKIGHLMIKKVADPYSAGNFLN